MQPAARQKSIHGRESAAIPARKIEKRRMTWNRAARVCFFGSQTLLVHAAQKPAIELDLRCGGLGYVPDKT
ncbi:MULTISPECIES: hypothetical protein [unclassified Mesorhizobium]|uniref:hypothetical protein n=1 Tax=unclassified Mesorhizobium TaxID=325217 RepID=UPI00333AD1AD